MYSAAEDSVNATGWRTDVLRVAAVVTGSHFAEAAGFDAAVSLLHSHVFVFFGHG